MSKKTTYLGQFTDVVANDIAGELVKADIGWFYKQPGPITRFLFVGEWGTRLFVDEDRLEEARQLAAAVVKRHEQKRAG